MQMCPFCDHVYDESDYCHCPYCAGELDDDDIDSQPCPECGSVMYWDDEDECYICSNCPYTEE